MGNLPALADLLVPRFKSIQQAVTDGNWGTAQNLELLPPEDVALTSLSERRAATKQQLLLLKLEEAKAKFGKRGEGGGG